MLPRQRPSAPLPFVAIPQGSIFKDCVYYAEFSVLVSISKTTLPPFQEYIGNSHVPPAAQFQLNISTIQIFILPSQWLCYPPHTPKISLHLYNTQKQHNKYLQKEGRDSRRKERVL